MLREGSILIGTLGTLAKPELAQKLAKQGVTAISMDAIPRITRAQSMDTLSSQATVGGYKAVLIAAERLPKFMPLLTTAAGTVRPARGIVMGAGVAGLMAIGTARRLGAVVEATDVRPGRQGAGPEPGRHLHRGRDDRRGEGEGGDGRRLRDGDERRLQAPPGGADRGAGQGGRLHHHHGPDPRPPRAAARDRRDGQEHEAGQRDRRHGGRDGRQRGGHRAGQGGRSPRRPDHRPHQPAGHHAGQRDADVRQEPADPDQAPAQGRRAQPRLQRRDHARRHHHPRWQGRPRGDRQGSRHRGRAARAAPARPMRPPPRARRRTRSQWSSLPSS